MSDKFKRFTFKRQRIPRHKDVPGQIMLTLGGPDDEDREERIKDAVRDFTEKKGGRRG